MKLSEYRNSSAWKGAVELGPKLMGLADDLPASEEMGLSFTLRQLMVELPATIAADQLQEGGETRITPVLKLLAALEIIDKVYPALDTASVRTPAEELAERLMSDQPSAPEKTEEPKPAPAPAEPSATPVLASEVEAPAAAAQADTPPAAAVTPAAGGPTPVAVTAEPSSQDINVHPDSGQQT